LPFEKIHHKFLYQKKENNLSHDSNGLENKNNSVHGTRGNQYAHYNCHG